MATATATTGTVEVDFKDLFLKQIGKGAFDTVFKTRWIDETVAVKCINNKDSLKLQNIENAAKHIHSRLENVVINVESLLLAKKALFSEIIATNKIEYHPNVVKLFGFTHKSQICLLMQYMPSGSVDKYIHLKERMQRKMAQQAAELHNKHSKRNGKHCSSSNKRYKLFVRNVMVGLYEKLTIIRKACHKIIHRDIGKSNNNIKQITTDTEIKICDFGMSRAYSFGNFLNGNNSTTPNEEEEDYDDSHDDANNNVIYSSFQGMNAQSKLYINNASIQPLIQDELSKLVWAKFTIDSDNPFLLHFNSSFNNNFSIDLIGIGNESNQQINDSLSTANGSHTHTTLSTQHSSTMNNFNIELTSSPNLSSVNKEIKNPKMIALSLKILAEFDSHDINISLFQFVRQAVCTYLDHDRTLIRKPTGITCCKLLLRAIDQMIQEMRQSSENSIYNCGLSNCTSIYGNSVTLMTLADQHRHQSTIIREVLPKILAVGVYDDDWQIREILLQTLGGVQDEHE